MAKILGPRRTKRKPEVGLQLNRSNNFTNGAIVYPMDGSQHSLGAYPSFKMALVGSPAVGKFNGASGVRLASTSDYLDLGSHAEMQGVAFTQLAVVRFDAFASVTSTISECSTTSGNSTSSGQFGVDSATGRLLLVRDNVAIVSESISTGPVVTTGKTCVVAVSYDGTSTGLAIDGIDVSSTTSANSFNTGRNFFLMSKQGDSQESARPCEIYLFSYWARAMSRAELVELTRNPYQLFIGPKTALAAPASVVVLDSIVSTKQGQTAAATATISSSANASCHQGQHISAAGSISSSVANATRQGQKIAANAAIGSSATFSTSQGQRVDSAAAIASHGAAALAQAQHTSASASTSDALNAVASVSQAQTGAASVSVSTNGTTSSRQAQRVGGVARISSSAAMDSTQAQSAALHGAIASNAHAATSQGQTVFGTQVSAGVMSARIRTRAAIRGRTSVRPA